MTTAPSHLSTFTSYAALRCGGAPPASVRRQLGLEADASLRLERTFLSRRPRFARHDQHVADVLARGGFPALPEPKR